MLKRREAAVQEARFNRHWNNGRITDETFSELAAVFLDYAKKHKRSWSRDAYTIRVLNLYFGGRRAADIAPGDILNYVAKIKLPDPDTGRTLAPATVNRRLACMKTIFSHAIRDGKLRDNPVKAVRLLKEDNIRDRVLSKAEFEGYMAAAPAWFRPMAMLAAFTGMRKDEIRLLDWSEVDLRGGWIHLKGARTKTAESRSVPLTAELVESFRRLRRGADAVIAGPVFLHKGKPATLENVRHAHGRACSGAGIEDFRFHDWRHFFVTLARRSGKQDRSIQKVTGHKTLSMLQRYDTVARDDMRRVVDGLSLDIMTDSESGGKNVNENVNTLG